MHLKFSGDDYNCYNYYNIVQNHFNNLEDKDNGRTYTNVYSCDVDVTTCNQYSAYRVISFSW